MYTNDQILINRMIELFGEGEYSEEREIKEKENGDLYLSVTLSKDI